jgi:hypothetical protein
MKSREDATLAHPGEQYLAVDRRAAGIGALQVTLAQCRTVSGVEVFTLRTSPSGVVCGDRYRSTSHVTQRRRSTRVQEARHELRCRRSSAAASPFKRGLACRSSGVSARTGRCEVVLVDVVFTDQVPQMTDFRPPPGVEAYFDIDATVRDFWAYALSNLKENADRGHFAEFLVTRKSRRRGAAAHRMGR